MEDQVLSIEQMQELIDMGVDTSKAHLWWYSDERTIPIVVSTKCNFSNSTYIPTFTLQDILKMLPDLTVDNITYGLFLSSTSCRYEHLNGTHFATGNSVDIFKECAGNNSLEAAFKMLKWCKQNNYI